MHECNLINEKMFKKNSSNRIDRNDIGEEFTGFAWMREKKIHQKIGIIGLFLNI